MVIKQLDFHFIVVKRLIGASAAVIYCVLYM